ncbi:MAG: hypothetical protein ABJO88_11945 [Parasphingorhabdus sp.]
MLIQNADGKLKRRNNPCSNLRLAPKENLDRIRLNIRSFYDRYH